MKFATVRYIKPAGAYRDKTVHNVFGDLEPSMRQQSRKWAWNEQSFQYSRKNKCKREDVSSVLTNCCEWGDGKSSRLRRGVLAIYTYSHGCLTFLFSAEQRRVFPPIPPPRVALKTTSQLEFPEHNLWIMRGTSGLKKNSSPLNLFDLESKWWTLAHHEQRTAVRPRVDPSQGSC